MSSSYIADFGYLGEPPDRRYMEDLLKEWGYTVIMPMGDNVVLWHIYTNQSLDELQATLDRAVQQEGPYENGKLTDVKVSQVQS